jgi:hypothetical protein
MVAFDIAKQKVHPLLFEIPSQQTLNTTIGEAMAYGTSPSRA